MPMPPRTEVSAGAEDVPRKADSRCEVVAISIWLSEDQILAYVTQQIILHPFRERIEDLGSQKRRILAHQFSGVDLFPDRTDVGQSVQILEVCVSGYLGVLVTESKVERDARMDVPGIVQVCIRWPPCSGRKSPLPTPRIETTLGNWSRANSSMLA
jgi:hypothetical protein